MKIKVSVITPCFNSEKTIRDTIESVLEQTYNNIEYILIDGGSTDHTVDIVEEYRLISDGRLRYISEKDNGIYDAMNKGIACADGDVIGIINSDDWYEADALEKAVQCFESMKADAVYGEIWVIDENGQRKYHTYHSIFPPHPSTFIRREIYQKFGMFDLHYRIAADRELLLRLMAKGIRFEHIDGILANFRETGISHSNSMACAKESYDINLKYLGKCPENILCKESIEEKYNRDKLVYISSTKPEAIKEVLRKQWKISDGLVIFGAGVCGEELQTILRRCHIPVRFFVDNDERKWGLSLQGISIFSPEILRYGSAYVIVTATKFQKDICGQLQNYLNPELVWGVLEEIRNRVIDQCGSLFRR